MPAHQELRLLRWRVRGTGSLGGLSSGTLTGCRLVAALDLSTRSTGDRLVPFFQNALRLEAIIRLPAIRHVAPRKFGGKTRPQGCPATGS